MAFFSSSNKKDEPKGEAPRTESQRLTGKSDKKPANLKTFVLALQTNDKLNGVPSERFEEGLRTVLPKGTKVARIDRVANGEAARGFEITLSSVELPEALALLIERGLLEGQVDLSLENVTITCRATGRSATVGLTAEALERSGSRYLVKTESPEVFVQYPPYEVHRRWLADDDYRAAYGRWRTQRTEEHKPARWFGAWPVAPVDETGPPWIRLRARDGKPDEYAIDFEDRVFLRFAFQGAEITIMRFNLKVLSNKLTNEYAIYRSLPLSLESIPKDVQDRMNRETDRFRALREPGKFGASFDLVRQAYEEIGGDYYRIEMPPAPRPASSPSLATPSSPAVAVPVTPGSAAVPEPSRRDPFESTIVRASDRLPAEPEVRTDSDTSGRVTLPTIQKTPAPPVPAPSGPNLPRTPRQDGVLEKDAAEDRTATD